jgi:GH15 family glucan-1,4-alpha-glucosidase
VPRIEDYAMIGDCHTAALVSRDASIDWLCLPHFDSGACFASLLGDERNGRWSLRPEGTVRETTRRYLPGSLVLETTFTTDEGKARVLDFMPIRGHEANGNEETHPRVIRILVGERGRVTFRTRIVLRLDYGSIVPWVRRTKGGIRAIAGPDSISVDTPVSLHGKDMTTVGEVTVARGDRVPFILGWWPSHGKEPRCPDAERALKATERFWSSWSTRCVSESPWRDTVVRSLVTLKALTDARTGGIVAAPTTSLPEERGGVRNWDYRFCWLRDATFTLYAMLHAGYGEEARGWREWLLRAAAGEPDKLQIMYGVDGRRRLTELELPWLGGFEGAKPVRIGNGASGQCQLDVYGEILDAMHQSYRAKIAPDPAGWNLQRTLVNWLEHGWRQADQGIWEVRGPRRDFTHSKVMAWVAFDRAIKSARLLEDDDAPIERWSATRDEIHRQVCERGYDRGLRTFVQSYGSQRLDASLLMIPLVGFLPATDERVVGTVAAIERGLVKDGLVRRYVPEPSVEGVAGSEGAFLPCTFWLCDCDFLAGRIDRARERFERLLGLGNDVGLFAEEYDCEAKRFLGNFPQAFTHVSVVNTAMNLAHETGPAAHRLAT